MRALRKKIPSRGSLVPMLRVMRALTAFVVCWTMLIGIIGLTMTFAAESQNYRLDSDPLDMSHDEHGTSDTFRLDGRTTWRAGPLESTNFRIVHDGGDTSSSSSGGNQPPSSSTAGGGSGGGRERDDGYRVSSAASRSASGSNDTKNDSTASSSPASASASSVATAIAGFDETSPDDTSASPETRGPPSETTPDQEASHGTLHQANASAEEGDGYLWQITAAEATITTRLGMIYRFESLFGSIPAYQSSGPLIRSIASGVRPGFITVESLLWPLGCLRQRRPRKKRTKNVLS